MERKRFIYLMMVVFLVLTTIACDVSFSREDEEPSQEQIEFELTRQSLQRTQTAQAELEQEPEEPKPVPVDTTTDDETDDTSDEDEDEDEEDMCYFSKFTNVETIPDGTKFDPGDSFLKTWQVRNEGTCDWGTDFYLEFEDGDQMGGPDRVYNTEDTLPGETYTFEVPMTAPSSDGDYTGRWRFKAPDGTEMGYYWVMITVGEPEPAVSFAVTSVSYTMPFTNIPIVCPSKTSVEITANITTNSAGMVTYKWDDSKGCSGCATKSISFDDAGTKSITHSMLIGAAGSYWAKIYIDEPNHQWFGQQNFSAFCN